MLLNINYIVPSFTIINFMCVTIFCYDKFNEYCVTEVLLENFIKYIYLIMYVLILQKKTMYVL